MAKIEVVRIADDKPCERWSRVKFMIQNTFNDRDSYKNLKLKVNNSERRRAATNQPEVC